MPASRDLFDDTSMTFGEHLEVLRVHILRALYGLGLALCFTLYYGESLVRVIRQPIDDALDRQQLMDVDGKVKDDVTGFDLTSYVKSMLGMSHTPSPGVSEVPPATDGNPAQATTAPATTVEAGNAPPQAPIDRPDPATLEDPQLAELEIPADDLVRQLHSLLPEQIPAPPDGLKGKTLRLNVRSRVFGEARRTAERINEPVTLNVQEAFLTYMKVAFVSALLIASPWIAYQIWLFVAEGLYPHERKYVHFYLPSSVFLFLGGAIFCFYGVFPQVLDFLLGYNARMGITAQIRISEWISFAVLLPLMFGISFQLPLVMLFLRTINVVQVADFRAKRRIAIFVIAVVSMLLTPTPDPMTMFLMMAPLCLLYELGILLCVWTTQPKRAAI